MAGAIRNFAGRTIWVCNADGREPALADFAAESNRGDRVWFAADEAELEARLAALP